jgi:adenosylcobyric acid synthase
MQAEACRVPPSADMNPVLIKPSSETGAQVVLLGKVWGRVTASDYHRRRVEELFPTVLESYERLAAGYDVIVLEGAGSPAEINLRAHDIVNMRMAHAAGAACLLVGDIDRGGVFAALYGTLALLEPEDRARIRGVAINKFRGDLELLRPGLGMLEQRIDRPCLGVVPFIPDLGIEEEDGVAVEDRRTAARVWGDELRAAGDSDRRLRVGIVALPHLANFTDFDTLALEPSVAVAYLARAEEAAGADVLVLPGTKQTLDDLAWLETSGFARALVAHAARPGGCVAGVCGGMQMLGRRVEDPGGLESGGAPRARAGLGLLPIATRLLSEKVTRRAAGRLLAPQLFGQPLAPCAVAGYEIHLGETAYDPGAARFAEIERMGESIRLGDGAVGSSGRVFGTYLHGVLDDDAFRHAFVRSARAAVGLGPPRALAEVAAQRARRFDRLADHVRAALDVDRIESWIGGPPPRRD